MSGGNEDDPLAGIFGDELGEWDKMFDSLHEDAPASEASSADADALATAPEPSPAPRQDPPTPVVPVDAEAIDSAAVARDVAPGEEPPTPAVPDIMDFALEEMADVETPAPQHTAPSELDHSDGAFTLGPPGAVTSNEISLGQPEGSEAKTAARETAAGEEEYSFEAPEALGSLLGSGPLELEERHAEEPVSGPSPDSALAAVALEDVLGNSKPTRSTEQELARLAESANAFFDEGEVAAAFELDDDFYDGIEIGAGAIPTPIPEDEPMASDGTPLRPSERPTPALGVDVAAAASADWSYAAGSLSDDASDGVPQAIDPDRHGALRTGAIRTEREDRVELESEVEGALDNIRTGPKTPPPEEESSDASSDESELLGALSVPGFAETDEVHEQETVDMASPVPPPLEPPPGEDFAVPAPVATIAPEPRDVDDSDAAGEAVLDGVVEAAFDDAVAMSTGTLLTGPQLADADVEPDLPPAKFGAALPELDLSRIHVAEEVALDSSNRTEEIARLLVLYERELTSLDEPGAIIRFRIEAGRLAESLGDLDRARRHLDEALKLDPRLVPANRALRRIERKLGNWDQVLRQLDNELEKAGAMEGRALAAYRADLLMAMGEPDLARVAVGELLDSAPNDTRALLANLELAFADGRDDEVAEALAALAETLSGPRLRSAVAQFAACLAAAEGDTAKAGSSFEIAAAASRNLGAEVARLGLAKAEDLGVLAGSIAVAHPELAAAAYQCAAGENVASEKVASETENNAAIPEGLASSEDILWSALGNQGGSHDAWCAFAEVATDRELRVFAFVQAAQIAESSGDVEVAVAMATRALELAPETHAAQNISERLGAKVEAQVPEGLPTTAADAFSRAEACAEDKSHAYALVDAYVRSHNASELPALRSYGLELARGMDDSLMLEAALADIAEEGSAESAVHASRTLARIRSIQALAATDDPMGLAQAAEGWRAVATGSSAIEGETALLLARASNDASSVAECAALASDQARSATRRGELAWWLAGTAIRDDAQLAADSLAGLASEHLDLRVSELFWSVALTTERISEAADLFDRQADAHAPSGRSDRMRYRAALARQRFDIDTDLAIEGAERVRQSRPAFAAAAELLAQLRGGAPIASAASASDARDSVPTQDALSQGVRRVEALARSGDIGAAAELSARLLREHPEDALAEQCFLDHQWRAGASAVLMEHHLANLRSAEERGDARAKAAACEELARIDLELRGDRDAARMFWESASSAAPERADLQRRLEAEYRGNSDARDKQRTMLGRVIASLEPGSERSAYLVARARLSAILELDAQAIRADYEGALADDPECRDALFFLESTASGEGPTEALATLEAKVAQYFADDPRARAAFLVRSGETWRSLDQREPCLARLKAALQVVPGFAPALSAWRNVALDYELWGELAEACLLEAVRVDSDAARASLCLLGGVTLMDRVGDTEGAIAALRNVLVVDPLNREAFVRLRQLYLQAASEGELAQLFSMRLEASPSDSEERAELLLSLARVLRSYLGDDPRTLEAYRSLLELRPNDREAVSAVAEMSWQMEKWADAAEALMVLARLDTETDAQISIFSRLGTIYAEHLPEPKWALKSFRKVATLDPTNLVALEKLVALGPEVGEYRLALGACEQLLKQEPPIETRIALLIRMSSILHAHLGDAANAERALRHALDLNPASDAALDALVSFYVAKKDLRSARVHVDRVANAMRKRIDASRVDGDAYRVLARAMAAKNNAGATECMPTAQVAASLALKLGAEDADTAAIAKRVGAGMATGLGGEEYDDLLFPASASSSVRTLFALLGSRLAKHIGTDIRHHGVGRSDRLRKGIDASAGAILELAADLGVDDVDIYVSKSKSNLCTVIPTSPVSLVLGSELATAERMAELRFFVGRSMKSAQAWLAAPLSLSEERFGVLLVGLLRQFEPGFAPLGVDADAATAEQQRLRRLIPSNLLQELRPYALGLATGDFNHKAIRHGLLAGCNRAGLVCAGNASAALAGLMRMKGLSNLKTAVEDAEIAEFVRFACSADHARLWAALRE